MRRLLCLGLLAAAMGCGDGAGGGERVDAGSADASVDARTVDSGSGDSGSAVDAGADGGSDAGSADAGSEDAGPPLACAFNRECPDEMFCDSDDCEAGCLCKPGARGTGGLGAACASGNQCASSVCLEGPGDELMCSIECASSEDCADPLPSCADVAFVGQICVRSSG